MLLLPNKNKANGWFILTLVIFTHISRIKQKWAIFFPSNNMLSNHWFKNHEWTADNCQILYSRFHLHWRDLFVPRLSEKLQSYSVGCSLDNHDAKDHIFMQIYLIARSSNGLLTVSHQWNPKPVFKYSLGQQNNIAATLSRSLSQCYVADFEQVWKQYIYL